MHLRTIAFVIIGLCSCPIPAIAQSAIAGQVRDNTGAVLPGATIEATSPALIEGRRVVSSDGQGRYSIVDLRPGIYTVTFTLEGFSTVIRPGVDLPSGFTATIDGTLSVGALQESVTVTGASPLVDVQQTTRTQVLSREALDTLVTSRTTWTQAVLLAGVQMTGTDVGGSRAAVDLLLETHGASARHSTYNLDGMQVNTMLGEGSQQNYYQDQSNQEVTIQTSGGSAEVSAGGVFLNMIPKDGGNTFNGTMYIGGSSGSWMADNFSQELRDQGVRAINRITSIFDYGATQGGPILKDRLWFHASARYWGVNQPVVDTFLDDGSQYIVEGSIVSLAPRLTFQATRNNKFRLHLDRQSKIRGPKLEARYPAIITGLGVDPETATTWQDWHIPYGVLQSKWTSTATNRLLFEGGYSMSFTLHPGGEPQAGVRAPDGTPDWFSRVRKTDIDRGVTWNGVTQQARWPYRHVVSGAVSYVTGTHNLKVGVQQNWGSDVTHTDANGHISLVQYRSAVPDSVTVTNFPVRVDPRQRADLGVFAQDSWSLNRLTLNAGLRFEWQNSYIPEQRAPAGRFVGERRFAAVADVPKWGPDLSPRLGLSYDLFGDAKTALKFSVGKYMTRQGVEFATQLNPMASVTASLPWTDRDLLGRSLATNGDDVVQNNELDLTRLPTNFGERQLDRLDPDLKREYNVELAVSAQHALTSRVSVAAGWYRRSFHNMPLNCSEAERADTALEGYRCSDNLQRDFDDYVPVEIVSPYNGEIITAYNLRNVAELSRVDNFVTNAKGNKEVYNGFEVSLEARLPGGGTVLGSSTTQRILTNSCDQRDDPNKLRFCDRFNLPAPYKGVDFKSDFKLAGSYPLPVLGLQVSGTFRTNPGRTFADFGRIDELLPINWNISRTTRYTEANCAGRPCTPGALVVPGLVQTSLVVPLAPSGTERKLPRLTQLDLGLAKKFTLAGVEVTTQAQLFNALNASTVVAERSANFGTATYALPSDILLGRFPRLSVQMKW